MPIIRDTTGELAEPIVNHPEVRPWVLSLGVGNHDRVIDLGRVAADPRFWILIGEGQLGCFIGIQLVDGVYEFHAAVLPEGRGAWVTTFADSAIHYMFTATDAVEIMTRVPQGYPSSLALVKSLGFSWRWNRPVLRFRGRDVPYGVWSLVMQDWWPPDDAGRVAAVTSMQAAGQKEKAASWHNRWAFVSRERLI